MSKKTLITQESMEKMLFIRVPVKAELALILPLF